MWGQRGRDSLAFSHRRERKRAEKGPGPGPEAFSVDQMAPDRFLSRVFYAFFLPRQERGRISKEPYTEFRSGLIQTRKTFVRQQWNASRFRTKDPRRKGDGGMGGQRCDGSLMGSPVRRRDAKKYYS